MRRTTAPLGLALASLMAALAGPRATTAAPPSAAPAAPSYVDWQPTVVGAFDAAKKAKRPLFIAINAEHVDGKYGREEPAGKELREHTYRAPAVVERSRQFVCVLVKPDGTSVDYAELKARLGIQGDIVSPQHIFVHLDGVLIERREYWKFAAGAASVDALLAMMESALVAHRAKTGMGAPGASGTPEEQRWEWIRQRLEKVRAGVSDRASRDVAIGELVKGDKQGDCITPLSGLLSGPDKEPDTVVAIVRGLGQPGLEVAVAAIASMLDDTSDLVRSNAAVSLEYIGSATAIEALTKRIPKEKDEIARNNCCRALGRCGAKQEAVRKTLLREFATAKTNKASAGPAIGLCCFDGDAETARGIEKILAPGVDWQKRAFGLYALTHVRDPKSAAFVTDKVLKTEKNRAALDFLQAVVSVLSGTDARGDMQRAVTSGVTSAVSTVGDIGGPARLNRDQAKYQPLGEFAAPTGRGR